MKNKILFTLIASNMLGLSLCALAEAPAPAVAPALTRQARATLIAGQLISQVTNILNGAVQVVNSGVTDQPNMPAIDAKDIQNALGPEYVAWLRSAAAGPISLPAPSPSATPNQQKK